MCADLRKFRLHPTARVLSTRVCAPVHRAKTKPRLCLSLHLSMTRGDGLEPWKHSKSIGQSRRKLLVQRCPLDTPSKMCLKPIVNRGAVRADPLSTAVGTLALERASCTHSESWMQLCLLLWQRHQRWCCRAVRQGRRTVRHVALPSHAGRPMALAPLSVAHTTHACHGACLESGNCTPKRGWGSQRGLMSGQMRPGLHSTPSRRLRRPLPGSSP